MFFLGILQGNYLLLLAVLHKTEEMDKERIVANAFKALERVCDFSVRLVVFTIHTSLCFNS